MIAESLALAALGLAAGFVGTLLGIGGGSLVSPMLILLGVESHIAVSSSLAAVVGTGVGGLPQFLRRRLVRIKLAVLLEAVTACGAILGSTVAMRLSSWQVSAAISAALALAGTIVLLQPARAGGGERLSARRILVALPPSFAAGMLSAMTGIGGGVVKMPILLAILGLDIRQALATSKMMILITALTGLANYVAHHRFEVAVGAPLAIGAFVGATVSAKLVTRLRRRTLRKVSASLYYTLSILALVKTLALMH
ncbi:MAG: sulfite exporter TauE/SafE family protein [Crenarchaeota archaeon]|nr:sulfite exporter TauE/SafE family protein [Thermoproteota archaeon]